VQVMDSARPSLLLRAASGVVAGLSILTLTSCSFFSRGEGAVVGYDVPLTVQLRSDPSIAAAQLAYQDACGQRQSLPIGAPLQNLLTRKIGRVFENVLPDGAGPSSVPDGYVDASLGPATVDLAITHKANKSYPAMVAVGLDFAYRAADGVVLYSKKLQSIGRGDVEVTDASCEVKGLDAIAKEAIGYVTDGMAAYLGTSSKIGEAAQARKAGGSKPAGQGALEVSAGLAAVSGQWTQAARMFGAADAHMMSTAIHRDPTDEAFLAPLMDSTRRALGAQGYRDASEGGGSLEYADAIHEARDWLRQRQ